ncbi:hypothetical protein PC114_g23381 [Phytophthora cactorum]|nr:hypothetical protein PC114_g23381 [Phytophthora cactorum]
MPLLYVLFFTSRMKRELLHPPHPSSDRTTGVLIWSLPPHVLMRHVRLRVEHVVSSREARDHAHYSHDDCSLLHRRTPPMVRTTTQLTTRVVDDLGADDDDSVDWTGYSAEEDEVADKIADKDDDLNCTAPGEDTAQYGATDSGDKAALDDIDTGKEAAIIPKVLEVDEATYAPDAAALKIAHEIRFEEQFLENIGGKEAGWLETPGQDLRKMSLNVWEDIEQPSTFDYMQSPLCPSNCGCNHAKPRKAGSSLENNRRGRNSSGFEAYCGRKQHPSNAYRTDMKSVPAAVVRNLLVVFGLNAE